MLALALLPIVATPPTYVPVPISDWKMQYASHVSEGGDVVSWSEYSTGAWYRAAVPGTVLTTLVDNGVYPEPLYGQNNRAIPESLSRQAYWYQINFPHPKAFQQKHLSLEFDRINYQAQVWVNGNHVGDVKGAFTRGIFDITKFIRPGQRRAVLAVEILPPNHPGEPAEQTQSLGTGRNGGGIGADGPTFLATVGWDWIPGIRDRDMGIWQPVTIRATGNVRISDPFIQTSLPLPRTDSADLSLQATIQNSATKAQKGILRCEVTGVGSVQMPVAIDPGQVEVVKLPSLHVPNPKLWWPNTYGKQPLYAAKFQFLIGEHPSDVAETRFGIRTIQAFKPGGKDLTILVNGVPIFCRGGNWGMDEALKRIPASRLDAQVRMHHDANCTMIRNWVGMSTEEDFYRACDKYGIIVWDDFWLANPVDGPNPVDPDLFLANAKEKILRYRNHPSIALWCGRNEGDPPQPINDGLAQMTKDLDGTRFYQVSSSYGNGVGGGGPYSYRRPESYFNFKDAFHTEIGGPSIPTIESIESFLPQKDLWPINDDWAMHDLCRGAQGGDTYPKTIADRFGPITGFNDFVRKSQLANYESYRAIFEGRAAKLFAPASGVLLWMSNPCQPSFVWQLYSYDLEPTAAMYGTKKGCEPIHIEYDPTRKTIVIVNTTPEDVAGLTAELSLFNLNGDKLSSRSVDVDAVSESATVATILQAPAGLSGVYFIQLRLLQGRNLLSENFYWESDNPSESGAADLSAMQSMQTATIEVSAKASPTAAGQTHISANLRNTSSVPAILVHLQLRRAKSKARVLPAFFDQNYVCLAPGEGASLTVDCATTDLKGEKPLLTLDGWNVAGRQAPGSPIEVHTNDHALTSK